ncbi:MAG: DUF3105 domain-containing protein [Candidatus Microsaccharimonas sossegonensis]|uniref:DUF3105 domain-containing protein n=1 Tax=Candidatus Microsaccharimonas sossegonensis TaxID=2506948 RepID=A0A4Q0AHT3_9BACT|nr:MAG: DUF3105 domain-containing protein [Candidatus Microsaccharimonas sossegonensis]
MSKIFGITIGAMIVGFGAIIVISQVTKPKDSTLIGTLYPDQGGSHISQGQARVTYNSDLASSGPHFSSSVAPTGWGVYSVELSPEIYLHNEEHGGVIIAYSPKLLSSDNIAKLKALVLAPNSNPNFTPRKVIVMPKASTTYAVQLASWRYTLNLDSYNEATIIKFFNDHAGKSPEPLGAPVDPPIDRSSNA